jgi:hypothetical protein
LLIVASSRCTDFIILEFLLPAFESSFVSRLAKVLLTTAEPSEWQVPCSELVRSNNMLTD